MRLSFLSFTVFYLSLHPICWLKTQLSLQRPSVLQSQKFQSIASVTPNQQNVLVVKLASDHQFTGSGIFAGVISPVCFLQLHLIHLWFPLQHVCFTRHTNSKFSICPMSPLVSTFGTSANLMIQSSTISLMGTTSCRHLHQNSVSLLLWTDILSTKAIIERKQQQNSSSRIATFPLSITPGYQS